MGMIEEFFFFGGGGGLKFSILGFFWVSMFGKYFVLCGIKVGLLLGIQNNLSEDLW